MNDTIQFDRRLTPARPDLAAAFLEGVVEAKRYVPGERRQVAEPIADLKSAPSPDTSLDTQALCGETVVVFEDFEGWAWAQLDGDRYVGYLPSHALTACGPPLTHRIRVARSFVYPGPNMKLPPLRVLPFGAGVTIVDRTGTFAVLADGGAVHADHLRALHDVVPDFVTVAESFIGTPYLWGGKTPDGLDCSGLVQISLAAAGVAIPRDTDMQEKTLGASLDISAGLPRLARGDLVYWKGHVGIMRDADTILHANAHHMLVVSEPLGITRARIAKSSQADVSSVQRLA